MLQALGIVLSLACVVLGTALIRRQPQIIRLITKTIDSSVKRDEMVMARHLVSGGSFVLVGLVLLSLAI